MKKNLMMLLLCLALLVVLSGDLKAAEKAGKFGIRGGLGTDINLGIAYGVGGNYFIDVEQNGLELGVVLFGGSFDEETDEGIHTYEETTDIFVFGMLANYLVGYTPYQSSMFFIAGFGLAAVSVEWEERSDTDESLGPLLPGGGSMQSEDASTGGTVFNLGVGGAFQSGLDIRFEIPVIVTFSAPGEASSVVPTFIFTLGYRF